MQTISWRKQNLLQKRIQVFKSSKQYGKAYHHILNGKLCLNVDGNKYYIQNPKSQSSQKSILLNGIEIGRTTFSTRKSSTIRIENKEEFKIYHLPYQNRFTLRQGLKTIAKCRYGIMGGKITSFEEIEPALVASIIYRVQRQKLMYIVIMMALPWIVLLIAAMI